MQSVKNLPDFKISIRYLSVNAETWKGHYFNI